MTLLAGVQVLASRYSGEADIAIGTPVAGRTHRELEGLIGCFVNTLVMRTDLRGQPTVRTLLARVRETTLGAYAHQDLPFERLVDALQPTRDLSHHPVFQVLFAFQNTPEATLSLPELETSGFDTETTATPFDFALWITERQEALAGVLEYSIDLFDRDTIARMIDHLQTIWAGMAQDPDARIDTLPLRTAAEREQILIAWNDTAAPVPATTVADLFAAQAFATPDAIAATCGRAHVTYRGARSPRHLPRRASPSSRRRRRRHRRRLHGPLTRSARRAAGRHESGRRLRAARPRLSGSAPRLHGRRRRMRHRPHRRGACGACGTVGCRDARCRRGDGSAIGGNGRAPAAGDRWRSSRVRDLHLRIHRRPEGCAGDAPRARQFRPCDAARAWLRRARLSRRGDDLLVRHHGAGDLRAVGVGRPRGVGDARGGHRRRAAARARRRSPHHDDAGDAVAVARPARSGLARAARAHAAVRRRSAARRSGRTADGGRRRAVEPVRADGDDRVVDEHADRG